MSKYEHNRSKYTDNNKQSDCLYQMINNDHFSYLKRASLTSWGVSAQGGREKREITIGGAKNANKQTNKQTEQKLEI